MGNDNLGRLGAAGQRQGQAGATPGDPGQLGRLLLLDPLLGEPGDELVFGHPAEMDRAAAGGDRRREVVFRLGDEDEHRGGRGLLERLEDGVGGLVGHHPRLLEEEDLPLSFDRRHRRLRHHHPRLVDAEVGAPFRHDGDEVGVIPLHDPPADVAARLPGGAQEPGGEMAGDGGLADSGRPHEQVGVGRLLQLGGEQRDHPRVADDAVEPPAHRISSMICATTSSTGRDASTSTTRSGFSAATFSYTAATSRWNCAPSPPIRSITF